MDIEYRAMTENEDKYSFRQSSQISGQCGLIGYLRADMDTDGNGFFSSWNDWRRDLKTDAFKDTFIFIDEIYLLFQHEYSANFLFTLWKRVRKYGAYATGITQNVDDLLQSHTARTMLANSEFIVMLNQASTDRVELAKLLNISDLQMSYITNVEAGHGLIKVGSSLVPFANKFPRNTKLYKLMTTKPGEGI